MYSHNTISVMIIAKSVFLIALNTGNPHSVAFKVMMELNERP